MRNANAIGSSRESKPTVMRSSPIASSKSACNVTAVSNYPGIRPCRQHGKAAPQPIAGATTAAIDRRPTHICNAVGLRKCCSSEAAEAKNRPLRAYHPNPPISLTRCLPNQTYPLPGSHPKLATRPARAPPPPKQMATSRTIPAQPVATIPYSAVTRAGGRPTTST